MKRKLFRSFWILAIAACFGFAGLKTAWAQHSETPVATQTPSPEISLATKEIVFGDPKSYTHPNGWFSVSLPGNWDVSNKSQGNEAMISVMDPTHNAVLIVRAWTGESQKSQDDLTKMLHDFLNRAMSTFPKFTMGEPKIQKDGSVGLYFKFEQELEGKLFPMYGDSFIEQHGKLVGLTFLVMPKEQYDRKQDSAYKVVNSLRLNPQPEQ